jgi:hypothetical protein
LFDFRQILARLASSPTPALSLSVDLELEYERPLPFWNTHWSSLQFLEFSLLPKTSRVSFRIAIIQQQQQQQQAQVHISDPERTENLQYLKERPVLHPHYAYTH